MGFFDKMKSALGNSKSNEEPLDGNYNEAIINDIENIPFAVSETNVMYAGPNELAGYHYFQTVLVGTLKVKTNKGAKLNVEGTDYSLELNSDMLELESEMSSIANRYITKFDFEIKKEDLSKVDKSKIESLTIHIKKEKLVFKIAEVIYDEEE